MTHFTVETAPIKCAIHTVEPVIIDYSHERPPLYAYDTSFGGGWGGDGEDEILLY